jgi:membrane protease YdiL (CAAX protease family)
MKTSIVDFVKGRPAASFLATAVGLGWFITFLAANLPGSSALLPLVAIPVSYVPAVVAWIILRVAGSADERRSFRRRLTRVRVGWRWYAFAIILPVTHLAGVALATVAGGTIPFNPALLAILPLFLLTNYGEEIGWRGYALPKLQERMTPLAASLVLGIIWAAFHWVALLGNGDAALAYIAISTVQLTAMSVILAFVFTNARQALPVVTFVHAMYDTVSIGVVPVVGTGLPLLAFALSAGLTALVAFGVIAATGASLAIPPRVDAEPARQPG